MSPPSSINYQARFDKLFREFSDLERLADAQDQFLRLVLRRLFFAIDRAYPQLSADCLALRAQLQQAGTGLLPLDRLRPLTEQLAERMRQIEAADGAETPDAGLPHEPQALSLRTGLLHLLDQIGICHPLQERLSSLQAQLQTESPTVSDSVLVDRVAALVNDMHGMDEREKGELTAFLKHTSQKLTAIDQYAQVGLGQIQADRDAQVQLNQAAKQQVRELSTTVAASTDLATLKQAVQTNLIQIGERFDQLRSREEQHLRKAKREIQVMQQHIGQLKRQTRTLHGQLRASLHHLLHDPLTGLPNDLALRKQLAREIARAEQGIPLCLAHWEIDGFREICRQRGSRVGDKMLHIVGRNLTDMMGPQDVAARLHTEEFLLLLPDSIAEQAQPRVDAMRRQLAQTTFRFRGEAIRITVSCGLAEYRRGETAESLLQRTEQALIRSRGQGTNHCTVV